MLLAAGRAQPIPINPRDVRGWAVRARANVAAARLPELPADSALLLAGFGMRQGAAAALASHGIRVLPGATHALDTIDALRHLSAEGDLAEVCRALEALPQALPHPVHTPRSGTSEELGAVLAVADVALPVFEALIARALPGVEGVLVRDLLAG